MADNSFRAQYGQDRFIYSELMAHRGGVFFEAGALDGVRLSNTYFFEMELGWTGVLVEMQKHFFPAIEEARPGARCFNCALATEPAERLYLQAGDRSGLLANLGSQAIREIEGFKHLRPQLALSWIRAMPVMDILAAAGVDHIDYFSLDLEGGELDVLRSLDFNRVRVNLFGIEDGSGDGRRFRELLAPLGYVQLAGNLGPDRLFVRRDFWGDKPLPRCP